MRTLATKILFQKKMLIFWWFIGVMALTIVTMYFFPAFKNGSLSSSLQSLPTSLQKILGDSASWNTVGGYITQQIFALRVPIGLSVLSIYLFSNLFTGDEKKGLLETQLSLTNGRTRVLINKIIASIIILILIAGAAYVGVAIGLKLINYHYDYISLAKVSLNCVIFCLDFGLITFLIGCISGSSGLAIGLSSAYVFTSYLITSMVSSVATLRVPEKFSLFHYYQAQASFSTFNLIIIGSIGIFCLVVGVLFFNLRDLKTTS
ncbi:MAG: ABC transporter permease subunit [bacterium]|jgi:ABC-type transport system involved in multi-copper enzyme maturation permease subunit